ncbi:MAG TPA: gamma-glutamyltransferase [Thermoanaerobaculia bacterium]|nr:gamma-glutamyltransferase [Thermoanaerobaculia bacterium]
MTPPRLADRNVKRRGAEYAEGRRDFTSLCVPLRSLRLCVCFLFFLALPTFAGSTVIASKAALSTASPYATKVGLDVLRRGGNAIDAAVAVSFALAVVHPQAGNVAGGGFLVYYDSATKGFWTLDYRETAPGAATRDMYVAAPAGSRTGPRAGGVPGTVAGLAAAHERFGTQPWKDLVTPAIVAARAGIVVDAELESDLTRQRDDRQIDQFPSTAAIFFPDGKPAVRGSTIVQSDLAATLERIAQGGADDFYRGETAKRLVDGVRAGGGIIGDRDLREYRAIWRAPLKIRFRDFEIYTMAPPSGGGLAMAEALNILAGFDLRSAGFQTARAIHVYAEAWRRAYIDRNRYIGDPASTRIPLTDLLSAARAEMWRKSIDLDRATPTVSLGAPEMTIMERSETTHFTIVDERGNIASMTTTINGTFGSGFVVPGTGFFLNNEMDDFAAAPGRPNAAGLVQDAPNAIEPGKRMASSMTPAIIFRDSRPYLALGTRGGPTIPTTILQVFLHMVVHGKSLADAVAAPRYHHQGLPERIDVERGRSPETLLEALNAMGHGTHPRGPIGDVHAVAFEEGRIIAVADPRRGGSAGGY